MKISECLIIYVPEYIDSEFISKLLTKDERFIYFTRDIEQKMNLVSALNYVIVRIKALLYPSKINY